MSYANRTKLMRTVLDFGYLLTAKFREKQLHGASVSMPQDISVGEWQGSYQFHYEIVAGRGILLRFVVQIGSDLDRGVLERSAVETARIVADARRTGDQIRLLLSEAQRTARRIFDAFLEAGGHATLVEVGIAPIEVNRERRPFGLEIRYEGLNDHLHVRRMAIEPPDGHMVAAEVEAALLAQARREDNLERARAAGGDFLIEGLSLAAVKAYAESPKELLRELARESNAPMISDDNIGRGSSALRWEDGVASVPISLSEGLSFARGEIWVRLPERNVDVASLEGTLVSRFAEHPLLPAGLVVESARWREVQSHLYRHDRHDLLLAYRRTLHAFDMDGNVRD